MAKASEEVSALWVTDSGASHNFCNDPSLFQNTTPIKMAIRLGDHSSVNAFYSGIVVLRTTHGTLNLHAIYVPQFRMSLLSVGQLSFKGWQVNFIYDVCEIFDPHGNLCATALAKSSNDLFTLQISSVSSNALVTTRSGGGIDVPSKVSSRNSVFPFKV
jgi:hypothetical protein